MWDEQHLWRFLPLGYAYTVAIELSILWFALSRRHPPQVRIAAGFWLTAVTYPIVVIVLPLTVGQHVSRGAYLAIAETFAPAAECALFYFAYVKDIPPDRAATRRDMAAIVAVNLTSFLTAEAYRYFKGWL